jgi:hypothetical protein
MAGVNFFDVFSVPAARSASTVYCCCLFHLVGLAQELIQNDCQFADTMGPIQPISTKPGVTEIVNLKLHIVPTFVFMKLNSAYNVGVASEWSEQILMW